jgi:N-acyl homoserine lactone hydrolase
MRGVRLCLFIFASVAVCSAAFAQPTSSGVDRLYVLECGHGVAPNQGRFSPGYNDGKPFELVDNCYLIHHAKGYFLWGTGIPDKFSQIPDGVPSVGGRPNWAVTNPLAKQLEELGIQPSAIRHVGLTNSHIDHIGNLTLFAGATVLMQKSEWDFAQTHRFEGMLEEARFKSDLPVMKLEGDFDVFGDGTVQIIATPSVTPGNQSLLVRLPQSGAILLSGDVIHFQYGWDHRIVPGNVWNKEKTSASFQRLTDVIAENNAKLWIEHDKDQGNARRLAPDYYQ